MKFFNELMFVAIFEGVLYMIWLFILNVSTCHLKLLCGKMVFSVNMLDLGMIITDISPMWKAIQICLVVFFHKIATSKTIKIICYKLHVVKKIAKFSRKRFVENKLPHFNTIFSFGVVFHHFLGWGWANLHIFQLDKYDFDTKDFCGKRWP